MVVEENNSSNNNGGWAPIGSPMNVNVQSRDDSHWTNFESSVNAVSFGFVATAILISMFLLMAIFERFLRPNNSDEFSPSARRTSTDVESQMPFPGKLGHPSPKYPMMNKHHMSVYASGVSVLMPGDEIPTFIAHPAPPPCCPERISFPSHHYHQHHNTSNI